VGAAAYIATIRRSGALQVNGRIFAKVSRGRPVLKLPMAPVADLVAAGRGINYDAGKWRPMKEWVVLVDSGQTTVLSLAVEALAFCVAGGLVSG
jgi:hypothetical protein